MIDLDFVKAKDEESLILSCGLLLPSDQEKSAIDLCSQIEHHNPGKLKFVLNTQSHPPFVRLYETVLPTANAARAIHTAESLAQESRLLQMRWGIIERTTHFVAIWGELNPVLEKFQRNVLTQINELREGYYKEKYIEDEEQHAFTKVEEQSFMKWGSPWAEPYVPHMIIAKAEPQFEVEQTELTWDYTNCQFRGLFVGFRKNQRDFSEQLQLNFQ